MFDESLFDDVTAISPVITRENHKAAKCHPESRHAAKGLCFSCYVKQYPKAKRASCHPGRIAKNGGLCKSCVDRKLKIENPAYDLDHCHETGTVRGLLCGRCNKGLGLLGDNEKAVMRALEYLRSHLKASINE
jgi:hypothetical protein